MYLQIGKPFLDLLFALLFLIVLFPIILLISIIQLAIYKQHPIFQQIRIGQNAKKFNIYKFRTITTKGETPSFLSFLRKTKLDELPQLINIIKQDMSFVGPRPDIPGYYDKLSIKYRSILELKPGLTGYASLKFSKEEYLLKQQKDPLTYNDQVIFPEKLKLNLIYRKELSLITDLKIIILTPLVILKLTTYEPNL